MVALKLGDGVNSAGSRQNDAMRYAERKITKYIWQACLNLVGTTFHFPVFLESCDDCGLRSSVACLDHVQDRNLSK